MTLIVEDGTGLSNAESYISVADATTYHANRGNTAWADLASDTIREQHLRKATAYLDQMYSRRWQGSVINATMSLDWPRAWVIREDFGGFVRGENYYNYYPSDEVPQEVKDATCEAALSSVAGLLLAEQGQGVIREKVGPLEVEYDRNSPQRRRFPIIDGLLAPLLKAAGVGIVRT